jgi:hypothetical protein
MVAPLPKLTSGATFPRDQPDWAGLSQRHMVCKPFPAHRAALPVTGLVEIRSATHVL